MPVVPGDQADEPSALVQVDRQHPVAEHLPGLRHHAVEVGAGVVELRDDDDPGHGHVGALVPERPRLLVDPLVRGDDEQGTVGSPQAGSHLAHEVDVSGGVQQVHLHPVVRQWREGEADGALLPVLDLVEVAHGGAVLGAAGPVQHPGLDQQPLDQGGLARAGRPDDQDVANRLRSVRDRRRLADHAACLSAHSVTPPACSSDGSRGVTSLSTRSVPPGKGEPTRLG